MTATVLDVRLLERARKEIGETIENRSQQIASGIAGDYADYRFRCGQLIGLNDSLNILDGIVKSMGERP